MIRKMIEKKKIVVVGAGISGLGAAYKLRKLGLDCIVFEAGARAGGRVTADVVHGFYIDPVVSIKR